MSTEQTRGAFARMFGPVRLDQPTGTSLARGGALSTVGLLAQGVLRFLTAFLVGHLAGQSQLGIVASAIATATTLSLLWPTTTGSAASKFLARARGAGNADDIRATAAHLRSRMLQSGLVLGLVSVPVWILIDEGSWQGALSVAALTLAYSGYSFTRGVQFGAGQVPRAIAWDLVTVALGLAGLAAALVVGVRGPALVLPLVVTYGLYAVAGWPYGGSGKPDRERRRELDGFVALGAAGTLASTGFLQLSQISAKLTAGNAAAGQYAAALNLATPASMLAASLSLVLLPSLSEAWGRSDHEGFRAQTDRATRALAVVMVAIFGSIIVCSRLLVDIVWGDGYPTTRDVLPVLVLAVLATNLGIGSVNALTTRSQRGMLVTTGASLLGMAVGGAFWLTVAPGLGITGVAVGYLCGTVVIAAIPVTVVWRVDGHRWAALFAKVAVGLAVVGGIVVAQRLAELPVLLDPALALAFLVGWWLLNRAEFARLPIPRPRRRR
ncbi:putative peptidoglycan lipid II flippase [Prauserella shujinwangii]|uniref:Putative peptidoglycan lipid II flippase n=1 Tax=Prauserella shujinwangii TaxID=1453103 RepID=A0A2T0LVB2_9PSEU|nr:lipid II flippase MurJ [Prauserella shujinwangii]PRX47764.1 putative peptidoglycan lipid II flippase [Prauserella shujinwangii]